MDFEGVDAVLVYALKVGIPRQPKYFTFHHWVGLGDTYMRRPEDGAGPVGERQVITVVKTI